MVDTAAYRIALITSSFAPHIGGVEEHVAQVARELTARGHVVEVWTVDRGVAPEHPFLAADGSEIAVRYLPTPLPARSLFAMVGFAWRWPSAWRAWRRAHRRLRPDVLHVHCFGPNGIYAEALHRQRHTPLIVTSHGETMGDDNGVYARSALLRGRLRSTIASAYAVTAPSRYVLNDLRSEYGLHAGIVVPNGVDLDVQPADVPKTGDYYFAVGRLGHVKGFDLLIDAFPRLQNEGVRLIIGGDGPERSALQRQAEAAGTAERVSFTGRLSPDQVDGYMRRAVAVVVPSRSEAFGIVALEAWRAGAPLVMTSRGGAAEFVTDGEDGVLVDPTDAEALSEALAQVGNDPKLADRLRANGSERVQDFTWPAVVSQYLRLYEELPTESSR
ncbi:glycosyltransferase family 4 protein [Microbacterium esteraromaticum]|uniref:glycosyltransferase family 4 protein n=1 Tax=Microbacterium esteraromaticum TaxID=57043 RepID=UPI001C937993|nr:glycosyltransferase family 4 protein [Microbacterium esteraromaticum]MBY6060269.1 glycosyltransferase family 4 protein [Microbacterium esteraromaticum]